MKILRFLFCAAMIMSAAVGTCYSANDNNEDEEGVRKAIETYFEGIKTKDIKLVMSVISPSFLQVMDVGDETGIKLDYDSFRNAHSEFFRDNDISSFSGEITEMNIEDNKATVETNTSLTGNSLKETTSIGGEKSFIFLLEKIGDKWLITDKQG